MKKRHQFFRKSPNKFRKILKSEKSLSNQTADRIHLPMETHRKVFLGIPTLLKRTGNSVSIRSDVWKHEFHKSIWKVGARWGELSEFAL